MLLMVEEKIGGGICYAIHQYEKANKNYMKEYDKNKDVNDWCGWGMSQKLPVSNF